MSTLRRRLLMMVGNSLPNYSDYRGVYIEDVKGYLYTEDEWDGSKTANGIAVLTDNCRFVMALQDAYNSYCQWGSYGTEVSEITTTTSKTEAQVDYDGEAQTVSIFKKLGYSSSTSDAPAAYYCHAFTFPNGNNGYLGAAGEWKAAFDNKAAIESALSKCGGLALRDHCWTSTQNNPYNIWYMRWSTGILYSSTKHSDRYARAFTTLKSESHESPYTFSFNIVTTDEGYEANAQELAILNKGLAIILSLIGENTYDSYEFTNDKAPQEFDLRINGVRNFNFYFSERLDTFDILLSFNDRNKIFFNYYTIQKSNPVFDSFILHPA